MEQTLSLASLANFFEIRRQGGFALGHDELGQVMAIHVFNGSSDGLGTVVVDGEQRAAEVVGADHTEGAFDELAVAGFALAKGGFGGALGGDVDSGGDDESHLPLRIEQSGGRPSDAAGAARAVLPLVLKDCGKSACAQAFEGFDGLGNLLPGNELVPGITANQGGKIVAGGSLAGTVEGENAASRAEA